METHVEKTALYDPKKLHKTCAKALVDILHMFNNKRNACVCVWEGAEKEIKKLNIQLRVGMYVCCGGAPKKTQSQEMIRNAIDI